MTAGLTVSVTAPTALVTFAGFSTHRLSEFYKIKGDVKVKSSIVDGGIFDGILFFLNNNILLFHVIAVVI